MPIHETVGYGAIHGIVNGTYADATSRGAASGFLSTDINKIYRQLDDDSLWIVLSVASGVPTWAQVGGSGGGLTYFTENTNTVSPNNTVRVNFLTPNTADIDADLSIFPKGAGALQLNVPDGTATGGDKRGVYGIDLQILRTAADRVASGPTSVVIGIDNKSSADSSVAIGSTNNADAANCLVTGYGGHSKGLAFRKVHGAQGGSVIGASQESVVILYAATTNATPVVMKAGSLSTTVDASTQLTLSASSALTFFGTVTVVAQAGGSVGSFKVEGVLFRDTTAGSTTLLGSSVTAISNTPGYTVTLAADTTLGGLTVTFTGLAATNLKAVCILYTAEILY